MIRIFQALLIVLVLPIGLASAQSRDVYTIQEIGVDETAPTVIEAQQRAFAAARLVGARRMIDRVTLAEDRAAVSAIFIDQAAADQMAAAVDVEEETRGAGRYRGRLAVVFNPANVRAFLTASGVPYIDQQAAKAVIVPVSRPVLEYAWNSAWPDQSEGRLAPTVTSRTEGYPASSDWTVIGQEAARLGASRAVIANLLGRDGAYQVEVSIVTPVGVQPLGRTRLTYSLADAVEATGALLDQVWKEASIVRDNTRTPVRATVLFTSLAEWNTLRLALAQSPRVSEFQTKAVSRDGAVVKFVFAGDGQRLLSDLRDRGVIITAEDIGYVMRSALTAAPFSSAPGETR